MSFNVILFKLTATFDSTKSVGEAINTIKINVTLIYRNNSEHGLPGQLDLKILWSAFCIRIDL